MSILKNVFAGVGLYVGTLWLAAALGVGDFKMTYGPSVTNAVRLTCIEFANEADNSVFNSTGVIRAGALITGKTESECKGRLLDQIITK